MFIIDWLVFSGPLNGIQFLAPDIVAGLSPLNGMDTGNIGGRQSMAPHRPTLRIVASVASHDVGVSWTSGSTHFRSLLKYRRLPGRKE